jgi:hypothetical protein
LLGVLESTLARLWVTHVLRKNCRVVLHTPVEAILMILLWI